MLLSCDPSHLRAGFTVGVRTDSEGGHIVDWLADKKNRADRARHFSLFFVSHAIFSRFLGRGVHVISFFRELNTKTLRE